MNLEWRRLCTSVSAKDEILRRQEENGLSEEAKIEVLDCLLNAPVSVGELEAKAREVVTSSALNFKLKNAVYKELFNLSEEGASIPGAPLEETKEPLEYVRLAQDLWQMKLRNAVIRLCSETKAMLAKPRPAREVEILRKKWNSIGADYPSELLGKIHPIYGPKDFLGAVLRTRDPSYISSPVSMGERVELLKEEEEDNICEESLVGIINVKSLFTLREEFRCLHPLMVQIESGSPQYLEKSNKVLKTGLWALSRELCKTGCPVGHRRELWSHALAVDFTRPEKYSVDFEELKTRVLKHHLLFEELLIEDTKKTAANDDCYFVFEDVIIQVLLCMVHDPSLTRPFSRLPATPLRGRVRDVNGGIEREATFPPSGIIPFHGFSLYVSPLCFLFERSDFMYAVFKQLYLRYFVHLHQLSSNSQGILSLCSQFECLLLCKEPELVAHLKSIDAEPLRLAFLWMMAGFSGYLDPREVLLLWDRVIGHNSLTIIPVMAVAIFEFRAANLLKATSYDEAETVLSELRCVKVLPLLQQTLFL